MKNSFDRLMSIVDTAEGKLVNPNASQQKLSKLNPKWKTKRAASGYEQYKTVWNICN